LPLHPDQLSSRNRDPGTLREVEGCLLPRHDAPSIAMMREFRDHKTVCQMGLLKRKVIR
jgi:hypothetical protein